MKWKSHIAIARAISIEMGLPEEMERGLCSGSVEPDRRPDAIYRKQGKTLRIARAPHHTPHMDTIMAYIWRARRAYLIGNDYWAVKNLGRALHYVQDKCVSPGKGFRKHDVREEYVADLTPPMEAVVDGIEIAVCSPDFVQQCVAEIRPLKHPEEILFQATLYSAAISAAVLGPLEPEDKMINKYYRTIRLHKLRPFIGSMAAVTSITSIFFNYYLISISTAMVAAVAIANPRYGRVCEEAEWFGLQAHNR
ncbi:MAG: hypothetical protein GX369_07020 [Euryarchaeota archaeon]|nr:hypothetical protein [Euryarchaeota archaeon]